MDSNKRTLRSHTSEEKRKKMVSEMTGIDHFGANVSPYVKAAMKQGGSLDETSRGRMYGDISKHALRGNTIKDVLPSFVAEHIENHRSASSEVLQKDLRVGPRKSEDYIGHQLTSTRVNSSHGSLPDSKQIAEPLSPQPHSDVTGGYHRAHASPFSLVGETSNKAHTVWAPSWGNITVDGHIEKRALKAADKGHQVYHFRFDTATHSTVGFVKQRKGKTQEFKAFSATYKRR